MTNRVDYGKILEKTLAEIDTRAEKPTLLLHACCAPCSSYTLAYLSPHFREIDVLFYNPNISPEPEYALRLAELTHLVERVSYGCPITVIAGTYEPERFYAMARGMEELPEGGARCRLCYEMRLRETARMARDGGYDYFTTTLSISPYKNAVWLNEIGAQTAAETGGVYLTSDFKKRGGYQRSIALSREYGLYRQDFCGCVYSARDAEKRRAAAGEQKQDTVTGELVSG